VGKFTIDFKENEIESCDYELIKVDSSVPKNAEVDKLVQNVLEPFQKIRTNVLGRTDEILHRYNTTNSTMDNLLLRAIAQVTKTDIAFSNGWRFGAPITKGNITENDLYNITPMNPPISTVELTGAEIKKMLEENLERTFSNDPFGQMGGYVKRLLGLQVNMRIENPTGHRIQEIYYRGSHLDFVKTYKVSFVTTQGVAKKYGKNRKEHSQKAVEAMKAFLSEQPKFSPDKIKSYRLV
jgi:5'-nucleotidase